MVKESVPAGRNDRLTSQDYWDGIHRAQPRLRLPSSLVISTRNLLQLLSRHITAGTQVLEIGFAPGKHLAYVAKALGARAAGIDYSENGIEFARRLFTALEIEADLRCEDVFATSFAARTFDFVYSVGVIEHFVDPRDIVRRHVELLRPGGMALILIPDYSGIYGKLQRYFDPESLEIHNLRIMSPEAMAALAPRDLVESVHAFRSGRINAWQISLEKRWPRALAQGMHLLFNAVALMQPFDIPRLCPTIALRMRRIEDAESTPPTAPDTNTERPGTTFRAGEP